MEKILKGLKYLGKLVLFYFLIVAISQVYAALFDMAIDRALIFSIGGIVGFLYVEHLSIKKEKDKIIIKVKEIKYGQ